MKQGLRRGVRRRARSQHIVDQYDAPAGGGGGAAEGALEIAGALVAGQPDLRRRAAHADNEIGLQRSPAQARYLARQSCGLIVLAPPQPRAVQRNGREDVGLGE